MKTTGALWKEYMASWPEGQWFDDSDETVNGQSDISVEVIPDDAEVEFTYGVVFKDEEDQDGVSLVSHFRKWLKARDSLTYVVSIPKDAEAKFLEAVKSFKGTVR